MTSLVSEDRSRSHAEYFVVTSGRKSKKLHLPAASSTETDPAPLCSKANIEAAQSWLAKALAAYPPGYRAICLECRRALTEAGDLDASELESVE